MSSGIKLVDLAKSDSQHLAKQLDVSIKQLAEGPTPGIVSKCYKKDEEEQLKSDYKSAAEKKGGPESTSTPYIVAKASYTGAAWRDVRYSRFGRKALRVAGLNAKMRAAYGRLLTMRALEAAEKKD